MGQKSIHHHQGVEEKTGTTCLHITQLIVLSHRFCLRGEKWKCWYVIRCLTLYVSRDDTTLKSLWHVLSQTVSTVMPTTPIPWNLWRSSDFYSSATLRLPFIFIDAFCETSLSQCRQWCSHQNTFLQVNIMALTLYQQRIFIIYWLILNTATDGKYFISIKFSHKGFSHNFILYN